MGSAASSQAVSSFSSLVPNTRSQKHSSLKKIRLIPFKRFKASGEFPRYPTDSHLTFELPIEDALNCFIVFISHSWLRGWPGAEGYSDLPHPDNSNHEKYRLCVEGIEKLKKINCPNFRDVFIWLDFGCINQNGNPAEQYYQLYEIMKCSDCLFTPLVDSDDSWIYEPSSFGPIVDYKAACFRDGSVGYLNRAWCRLEMFYASCVPLKNTLMRDDVARNMKVAILDGRRPHFLYGSKESVDDLDLIEMLPLELTHFSRFDPQRGYLTRSTDEPLIAELVQDELLPLLSRVRPGYRGTRNHLMQKHGRGRCVEESGDIYDGEYYESRKQGRGKMVWANGDIYTGEWAQGEMHGQGRMLCVDGSEYDGEWREGKRAGIGRCRYADGGQYDGEWANNTITGRGTYRYPDGSVYEGDFIDCIKDGAGKMTFSNGDVYTGDWKDGYMHGNGFYRHTNGNTYDGEWELDKKSGYGVYTYSSGSVYEGQWANGKKHGIGTLTNSKTGACFEGEWRKGVWKG